MKYKIDWLSFTVDSQRDVDFEVLKNFGYDVEDFEKINGRYFYSHGMTLGNYVNVFFNDNKSQERYTKNTVCYVFTGQGCTDLDKKIESEWNELFVKLLNDFNAKITRIDIALDDFDKNSDIKFDRIEKYLKNGWYRSSKKSYNIVKSSDVEARKLGQTIYIGSRTAKNGYYARFYDKRAQYIEKSQILSDEAQEFWQRYEISYSKDKAHQVAILLSQDNSPDLIFKSSMRKIVEFLIYDKNNKNKNRWKIAKWWAKFLEIDESIQFESAERDVDFASVLNWLKVSVLPTLFMLHEAFEKRDESNFFEILAKIEYKKEFSKKQKRLIKEIISLDDENFNDYLKKFIK